MIYQKKETYPKTIKNPGHHCFVPDALITLSIVRYYKKETVICISHAATTRTVLLSIHSPTI